MNKLREWTDSILVRLGVGMALIATFAILAIVGTTVVAEFLAGKGVAINLAGSLRMQSYQVAALAANERVPVEARLDAVQRAADEFDARLRNPQLLDALPADADHPIRVAHAGIVAEWRDRVRPHALAAASNALDRARFLAEIAAFVGRVDQLVTQLESQLESRVALLRLIQGAALFMILIVAFAIFYMAQSDFVVPLNNLLQAASAVRRGDFDARAAHVGEDELGQLGQSFNFMVADLSKLYADLEARVASKTAELERSNRSLELLYRTTSTLASQRVTRETLNRLLADIERVAGIRASAICARLDEEDQGFVIARDAEHSPLQHRCDAGDCRSCLRVDYPHLIDTADTPDGVPSVRALGVPLVDSGRIYGMMSIRLDERSGLDPTEAQLVETIGHHLASALSHQRRTEHERRLALLEERGVIARELHDSLAQSLSYLKIQVSRLAGVLGAPPDRHEGAGGMSQDAHRMREAAQPVLDELRDGLNNAYRQLRELLTTFRLQIDGRGLAAALGNTVSDFAARTGLEVDLQNSLAGAELSPHEEIHVLQVIREALSNVEHHAHARRVSVRLASDRRRRVRVSIEDDGVGVGDARAARHHYGIAIMHDRAASLGGRLELAARAEGGTRVSLEFDAQTAFGERERASIAPELATAGGVP